MGVRREATGSRTSFKTFKAFNRYARFKLLTAQGRFMGQEFKGSSVQGRIRRGGLPRFGNSRNVETFETRAINALHREFEPRGEGYAPREPSEA